MPAPRSENSVKCVHVIDPHLAKHYSTTTTTHRLEIATSTLELDVSSRIESCKKQVISTTVCF